MTPFLAIGIGCRRGTSADDIDWAVRDALGPLDMGQVGLVATLMDKTDEPGILEFCNRHALPLRGIDSTLLNAFPIGDAASSEAVQRAVGVNAVCEPCAVIATGGGELIVRKTSRAGVSVAIAAPGNATFYHHQDLATTMKNTDEAAHQRMTERRREGHEKKQAAAVVEKGLLVVNTGTGKGKTTAAFGMAVRVLGHGMRLGVVQFIKGALHTAERDFLGTIANCDFITMGDGYTWNTQDRDADIATARKGWAEAERMIRSGEYDMVILDELNTVLKYEYLPLDEVLEVIRARVPMMHVVVTGRHAPDALLEAADLATDMRIIKHPYREQGVKAQRGVEF